VITLKELYSGIFFPDPWKKMFLFSKTLTENSNESSNRIKTNHPNLQSNNLYKAGKDKSTYHVPL
jgi:hypothetical protein